MVEGGVVADPDDLVDQAGIEDLRDEAGADTVDPMLARRAPRQHRAVFRLDRHQAHRWEMPAQHLAEAVFGQAGAVVRGRVEVANAGRPCPFEERGSLGVGNASIETADLGRPEREARDGDTGLPERCASPRLEDRRVVSGLARCSHVRPDSC